MSERPRDEDELQALLDGESALSRHYRELSDELPPAHVDAAILAASQSAVDADKRRSDSRRSGSLWSRLSLMQWSVPLGTAAVVVIAATLTLTVQRDPEIDRLYDKYDNADKFAKADQADEPPVQVRGLPRYDLVSEPDAALTTESVPESALATQDEPVPTGSAVPESIPPSPSIPEKEQDLEKDVQRSKVARKRSNYFRPEPVQSQSGNREAPASTFAQIEDIPVAEGKVAAKREMSDEQKFIANEPVAGEAQFLLEQRVVDAPQPAEAFPRSDEVRMLNEPADVGVSGAEVADDAFAVMDTPVSPESADAIEAEEVIQSAIESSSDGRFGSAVRTESEPAEMRQFVDRDATGPSLEAEAMRDPAGWIEDVEKLLAEGRRDEAIASLERFRLDYPYYPLPENLQNLLALEPE